MSCIQKLTADQRVAEQREIVKAAVCLGLKTVIGAVNSCRCSWDELVIRNMILNYSADGGIGHMILENDFEIT